MANLHVRGAAEREFPADCFTLRIEAAAVQPTAAAAAEAGRTAVEAFLQKLSDTLGIAPEQLRLEGENLSQHYGQEPAYRYTKNMSLRVNADLQMLSAFSALTEQTENITYSLDYSRTDMAACEAEVMRAAIADSRAKAELIASGLGTAIAGAGDVRYEVPEEAMPDAAMCRAAGFGACKDLAAQMQLPVVTLRKEIVVVWKTAE